jgi:peptidoglycan hydrolase-like protein with peptidoglycan-binding domain
LQQSLNLLMKGPPIRVDGNMGPATVDAIKTFQKSRGLVPDGWAGILTMGMIDDEMKTGKRK